MNGVYLTKQESIRFQIISQFLKGGISRKEAALILKCSERTIARLARKIESKGVFGVKHGNYGSKPNKAFPESLKEMVLILRQSKYFDYNLAHFTEILEKDYKIKVSHTTVWKWCKKMGLAGKSRRRRRIKRVYRDRMPQEGLLLQLDGSHHKWNGKDEWCLITAIDDATSSIPYAEFFKGETTLGCMKVLKGIIETKGVPKAIYTDKAGWSGGGKRTDFSQFQRACEKLGIQIIYADSPEAKGRIERAFRTFQDRLIPEMRSKKIRSMKKANTYLRTQFLKNYWNKKNTVKPLNDESAYSPLDPFKKLDQILVIESRRKIGTDHVVSWNSKRYKVDAGRFSVAGYEAVFREGLDGSIRAFVLENEVRLEEVKEPQREALDEESEAVNEPVNRPTQEEIDQQRQLMIYMAKTIIRVRNRVVRHMVTGKPLNLKNLDKEVA